MGRPAVVPPAGRGWGLGASPRGGVGSTYLHKRCHSVILAGWLAGPRGMGWVGRRLCVRRRLFFPVTTIKIPHLR